MWSLNHKLVVAPKFGIANVNIQKFEFLETCVWGKTLLGCLDLPKNFHRPDIPFALADKYEPADTHPFLDLCLTSVKTQPDNTQLDRALATTTTPKVQVCAFFHFLIAFFFKKRSVSSFVRWEVLCGQIFLNILFTSFEDSRSSTKISSCVNPSRMLKSLNAVNVLCEFEESLSPSHSLMPMYGKPQPIDSLEVVKAATDQAIILWLWWGQRCLCCMPAFIALTKRNVSAFPKSGILYPDVRGSTHSAEWCVGRGPSNPP